MNKKIVNIIGPLTSIVLLVVLTSSFIKGIKRIRDGDALIKKNQAKLEKQVEENKKLEEQVKIVQSDEFMEEQLRNKLGLVKEGEIVIVLPEADIVRKLAPIIPEEEEAKPKRNYIKWLDLFR